MTTVNLSPVVRLAFLDPNGNPAVSYKLFVYQNLTQIKAVTYLDASGTVTSQNSNPIILDSLGECDIWIPPATAYTYVFTYPSDTDPPSNPIWTRNNISNTNQLTQALIGAALWPQTQAEANINFTPNTSYPPGNLLRLNLVANSSGAAAANVAALQQYFNYATPTGPTGSFYLPNQTGADVYYISDFINFRPGVAIDGEFCTLSCSKVAVVADTDASFLFAVQDFTLENLNIEVNYQWAGGATNAGQALGFGCRGGPVTGSQLPTIYDSQLAVPMGDITVRSVTISSNTTGGIGVYMIGGLQNVIFENIWITGSIVGSTNALNQAIYYEFGWATQGTPLSSRQTSHMHNASFRNIKGEHLQHGGSTASSVLTLNGAYDIEVHGIYGNDVDSVCLFGAGESLFYNPWAGVDDIGSIKPSGRTIRVRGAVGRALQGVGADCGGANSNSGGYLSGVTVPIQQQTEQLYFDIEDFSFDGLTGIEYGIRTSAGQFTARNGKLTNCARGIVTDTDCTLLLIENVTILNSASFGIQVGILGTNIYSPPRQSIGRITGCFIAGSGTNGTPSAAINAGSCIGLIVESCRFGYELAHDNIAETVQTNAITIAATAFNVLMRNNYVAATTGGAVAYRQDATTVSQGCEISGASGVATYSGFWNGVLQSTIPNISGVVATGLIITYGTQRFDYIIKNGMLNGTLEIVTTAVTLGSASGNLLITNLPVQPNNSATNSLPVGALQFSGVTKANYNQFNLVATGGSTNMTIGVSNSGQPAATLAITELTPISGVVKLFGSISYFI